MKRDFILQSYREFAKPINGGSSILIGGMVGENLAWSKEIAPPPLPHYAQTARVQIFENMLKVRVPSIQPPHLAGLTRGLVGLEFSGKMRKRFLDRFNAWHVPNENLVFVHLTYPAEFDQDWHTWKLHLKTFKAHLQRRFPQSEGFWKLELQRRGAPHYHMIIDLRQKCSIRRFRQWLDGVWARIAHDLDQYGGKYACRAEIVTSVRHARNYVSKYMSKLSFAPVDENGEVLDSSGMRDTIGRMWGKLGKPDCSMDAHEMIDRESVGWYRLRLALELKKRSVKGWKQLAGSRAGGSFTVYGLGTMSDDRFKNAQSTCELLALEWLELEGSLYKHYHALGEALEGVGVYEGVKVGQNSC